MSKVTSYSLWLVPEESSNAYEFLHKLIYKLSLVYGTPAFNPHVTLLGAIEGNEQRIKDKVHALVKKLTPYEITVGEIDSNMDYFQALFSKIEQTPQVLNAYNVAQKVLDLEKSGEYFPHLSLAYGDFSGEQVVNLKRIAGQEGQIPHLSFLIKGIELWRTEGVVEKWYKIATFPFGKS